MNQRQLDSDLERSAADTLARMGIDVPSAINMFLRQIVNDQGFPFQPTLHPQFSAIDIPITVDDDNAHEIRDSINPNFSLSDPQSETVDTPQLALDDDIHVRRELEKMSFRVPKELADEIRGAYVLSFSRGDTRSLSQWVVEAIVHKLKTERDLFNDGRPFEPRGKGTILTGRR